MSFTIGLAVILLLVGSVVIKLFLGPMGFLVDLAILLVAWGASGMIAGMAIKGKGYGAGKNILIGLVGGIVGSLIFNILGLGWLTNISIPIIGGILWLVIYVMVGAFGAIVTMSLLGIVRERNTN